MLEFIGYAIPVVRFGQGFFRAVDHAKFWRKLCIQLYERDLVLRNVFFGKNGIGGAFWHTDCTIAAFVWVDDQKVGAFTEAINRTDIDTVGEFAFNTVFGDHMGHFGTPTSDRQIPSLNTTTST